MTTKSKADRPTIYTESDQILKDFSIELEKLKSRMVQVEAEQDHSRYLLEQLAIQNRLSNELIEGRQEASELSRESFGAIANVMCNLKSPIFDVVDNLGGIIDEIDDEETKDTLKDCMDTASSVLDSFSMVEEFCTGITGEFADTQEAMTIREFFREKISFLNKSLAGNHTLRLLVDQNVPDATPLYADAIEESVSALIAVLQSQKRDTNITIAVSREKAGERYGIALSKLVITIANEYRAGVQWQESWMKTLPSDAKLPDQSGIALLKVRDRLHKIGGHLEWKTERNWLRGCRVKVPFND